MGIKIIEDSKVKLLAYYQILGGLIGLLIEVYSLCDIPDPHLLIALLVGILFVFSIYCGLVLLKGKLELGCKLSLINQIFQFIHFSLLGYTFKYVSGFMFDIGIDYTTDLNLVFDIVISTFEFSTSGSPDKVVIGLNITSVFVIYHIEQLRQSPMK
jgi:hypothetical protein